MTPFFLMASLRITFADEPASSLNLAVRFFFFEPQAIPRANILNEFSHPCLFFLFFLLNAASSFPIVERPEEFLASSGSCGYAVFHIGTSVLGPPTGESLNYHRALFPLYVRLFSSERPLVVCIPLLFLTQVVVLPSVNPAAVFCLPLSSSKRPRGSSRSRVSFPFPRSLTRPACFSLPSFLHIAYPPCRSDLESFFFSLACRSHVVTASVILF